MKRTRMVVAVVVLTLSSAGAALGSFGTPDTTYGNGGMAFSRVPWAGLDTPTSPIYGLRTLSDGRLEYITTSGDGSRTVLTRVRRAAGSATAERVRIPIGTGSFRPWEVAPAGAGYLVRGQMLTTSGLRDFLVKLTATGARDTTFGQGGVVALPTEAGYDSMAVGPRGQVAVGMYKSTSTGSVSRIFMLRPNGSRDTTFGTAGFFSFPTVDDDVRIERIRFMGDGRIYALWAPENRASQLVRLTATGRRDTTYSTDGTADAPALSSLFLRDFTLVGSGKVAVLAYRSIDPGPAIAYRVNADGRLDTTFNVGAGIRQLQWPSTNVFPSSIARRPDGRLVMVGQASGWGIWLARTDANGAGGELQFVSGTIDHFPSPIAADNTRTHIPANDFNLNVAGIRTVADTDTLAASPTVSAVSYTGSYRSGVRGPQIAVDPAGRVFMAGGESQGVTMSALTPRGRQDTAFGPSVTSGGSRFETPGSSGFVMRVVRFANGTHAVLAGTRLQLMNANGTPLTSFGSAGLVQFPGTIGDIERLADGRYVVAYAPFGQALFVSRLNANGTPDTTFGPGGTQTVTPVPGTNVRLLDLSVSSAGYLVAAGAIGDGASVVRFQPSGALDTSIGTAGIVRLAGGEVAGATVDPRGRLLLVGDQTTGTVRRLTRLMTPDPTFSGDGRLNYGRRVASVTALPDSSILISAEVATYRDSAVHLDSAGRIIAARVVGFSFAGEMTVMADGRLLFTPDFTPQDSAVIRLKGVQPLRATSPRRLTRTTFRARVMSRGLRSTTMSVQTLRSGRWVRVGRRAVPALIGTQVLSVRTTARSTDRTFRIVITNPSGVANGRSFRG